MITKPILWLGGAVLIFLAVVTAQGEMTLKSLRAAEKKVKEVAKHGMPATVAIIGERGGGTGSGVIVDPSGLILTAAHVTEATGDELRVIFPDGTEVSAIALGANRRMDAGLAKITEEGQYPYVEMGSSSTLKANDWCVAIGHAGGFQPDRSPPVRVGRMISTGDRGGMLVSDCTLIGGDSGGPLFGLDGKVIGIHSSIGNSLAANRHVPIAIFERDWSRLEADERWGVMAGRPQVNPDRPMLGVELDRTDGGEGVSVKSVLAHSPAERAGLEDNDVILKIDGQDVTNYKMLTGYVRKQQPGDKVTLTILRDKKEQELVLKLGRSAEILPNPGGPKRGEHPGGRPLEPAPEEKPEPKKASGNAPYLGIKVRMNDADNLTIYQVRKGSPAAKAGLKKGDQIAAVAGKVLKNRSDLVDAVTSHQAGDVLKIELIRKGKEKVVDVELAKRKTLTESK